MQVETPQFQIGQEVFVRTVTDYWQGTLIGMDGPMLFWLRGIVWVAETGLLGEFCTKGAADKMEIEILREDIRMKVMALAITDWPFAPLRNRQQKVVT